MARGTVANQLIESHLQSGRPEKGTPIAIRADQALLQDATGTLVMLELLALDINRITIPLAVQYVDHNLLQEDSKNPDDHIFLQTACERLGLTFSRPGNGVSHPVHMARFAKPGLFLIGADSHTCAAGSMGMLAIGTGGLDVGMAIMGEPFQLNMPEIWGIELTGRLPDWVSAKDVILELLRRRGVAGGRGKIFEYFGPGLQELSAMDRHVIANMGAELGATSTVFPSDERTREFLRQQGREAEWFELKAERGARFDGMEQIDLSKLEPLIAKPQSPGNVVRVTDVEGEPVFQSYIGSSANPGFRDFAIAAEMLKNLPLHRDVSLDIVPTSREILQNLINSGHLQQLIRAGARIHQTGCNGCIGMGQAPATATNSLRTTPRNFPGRSGSPDDRVWLCSPETATAAAIRGRITDPRSLGLTYPRIKEPEPWELNDSLFVYPLPLPEAEKIKVIRGPNIKNLLNPPELSDSLNLVVALKVGDNISTDEILPAGARALPYRSNIEKISEFAFIDVDPTYAKRAKSYSYGHIIIAGKNYGQGSSREHAALALVHLGLRIVIAESYARIHFQNLVNFGVVPFTFADPDDYQSFEPGGCVRIRDLRRIVHGLSESAVTLATGAEIKLNLNLTEHQRDVILKGGMINWKKERLESEHRWPRDISLQEVAEDRLTH